MGQLVGRILFALVIYLLGCGQANAHFGMVIPAKNIVDSAHRQIDVVLSFSHPFEGRGMDLVKPEAFYYRKDDQKQDLLGTLRAITVMGKKAWQTKVAINRPGVYQFVMKPRPYWEAAEDIFIIHYTKTIIAAYGADTGWDKPAGLATEIVPLTRPFANYAGNSFTGQVLLHGKPVSFAEVEVEYYNQGQHLQAPTDYHITQVIKTDGNGIFTFTCPVAGWWGFAALNEADYTLPGPDGGQKHVELGAVLWIALDKLSPSLK